MGHPAESLCVARVPLFSGLTLDEMLEVARRAKPIRRSRGEVVQHPDEDHSLLLVLHSGRVRVTRLAANGHEQLVRVLGPGEFVGEAAFVTGSRPDSWATALTDVELCSFDHVELQGLVKQFPDIALRMLYATTTRLEAAEQLIAELTRSPVSTRLARYLVELPTTRREGQVLARLPHAKKDVASLLGTTPETLSRQLARLAEAGIVSVVGRDILVLDGAALERQASDAEASG